MSQSFSQIKTGLLTNQPNQKHYEPQKECIIEMEDMTYQQSYVLLPNEQINHQSKQQQLNNSSALPQKQGNNHLSQNQIQHRYQNQQQIFVPQSILNNYQYNKQQFAIKLVLVINFTYIEFITQFANFVELHKISQMTKSLLCAINVDKYNNQFMNFQNVLIAM
ncbi:unnamed protein product [Paramecium pentaurelia]|uniref:Uncharacterized protein n=1 Tax=Paramecium pentaurelia TaxID=43138 RepID=A0A8S1TGJ3_9CILI|nr:unnamed protein product [Paramecium pentaurelia]